MNKNKLKKESLLITTFKGPLKKEKSKSPIRPTITAVKHKADKEFV